MMAIFKEENAQAYMELILALLRQNDPHDDRNVRVERFNLFAAQFLDKIGRLPPHLKHLVHGIN